MELVWYACYGSNMDLTRFMKYIEGGVLIVNGKTKEYDRCLIDPAYPRLAEPYIIHRRFYFARESGTWDTHGVGFISNKVNKRSLTYAKLYLISKHQFKHLFEQENDKKPCTINYEELQKNKKQDFNYSRAGNEWFYGRILQLEDDYQGHPVLTFTTQRFLKQNKPMEQYVQLISDGIQDTHDLAPENIAEYLKKAKRIKTKR